MASSISFLSSAETLSSFSLSIFSVLYAMLSAMFLASTASRRFLSSSACSSASDTMLLISSSERPLELVMVIACSLLVPRSLAETFTMPLASMSNVTSIWGTPRGAAGMPTR